MTFDVVVPTVGRPSLHRLLRALTNATGPMPEHLFLVDDRRGHRAPLVVDAVGGRLARRIRVLGGRGAGPAAARNVAWRASRATWVAFLDDDVVVPDDWLARLAIDLDRLPPDVAGSQARLVVPAPVGRAPTDWERNVMALERARWATADMAYRRAVLAEVGGFDERFPRPYREDADLALRVLARGHRLVRGARVTTHPVRPADRWVSVRLQAGNADDALMAALHGRGWRGRVGAPRGRRARHLAVTAMLALGLLGLVLRTPALAGLGLGAWLLGTADLAWARIAPGPCTVDEIVTMVVTSAVIPVAATAHWLAGVARRSWLVADTARAPRPAAPPTAPAREAA